MKPTSLILALFLAQSSFGSTIAVIDSGTDFEHPELSSKAWTNPIDIDDAVDNDDNGYIDDIHGWDFVNHDNTTFDGVGVPIAGVAGDQQAALFGHGCAKAGDAKITFGTGAFALSVAGPGRLNGSRSGILPTLAWQQPGEKPCFALEGGVYNAASAVNWVAAGR